MDVNDMKRREMLLKHINSSEHNEDSYKMYEGFGSGYLLCYLFEDIDKDDVYYFMSTKAFKDLKGKVTESDLFSVAIQNLDDIEKKIKAMRENQKFLEDNSDNEIIRELATYGRNVMKIYEPVFKIIEGSHKGNITDSKKPKWLLKAEKHRLARDNEDKSREVAIELCELFEEGKLTLEHLREGVKIGDKVIVPYHGGHYTATFVGYEEGKAIVELNTGKKLYLEDSTILSYEMFKYFSLNRCGAYENDRVYDKHFLVLCELKHGSPFSDNITLEYDYKTDRVKIMRHPGERGLIKDGIDNYHKYFVYEDEMENLEREKTKSNESTVKAFR